MADIRITSLALLTSVDPVNDPILIEDVSSGETKKTTSEYLKLGMSLNNVDNTSDLSKPISTATQSALDAKQGSLTLTTIGTAGAATLVGDTLNIPQYSGGGGVAGVSSLENLTGDLTLVAGSNVTITDNGTNEITIAATSGGGSPSGASGAIQFSDGSAFASDAANLFWDDTNNRLGIGTNAPSSSLEVSIPTTGTILTLNNLATPTQIFKISKPFSALNLFDIGTTATNFKIFDSYVRISVGAATTNFSISNNGNIGIGIAENSAVARVDIKGSGTTSATTSLLVQNSAGTEIFKVNDAGDLFFNGLETSSMRIHTLGNANKGISIDNEIDMGAFSGITFKAWDGSAYSNFMRINGNTASRGLIIGGTTNNASAKLQIDSTTQGFLPPRMTTTQRDAIATPASGLQVYDSTVNRASVYSTAWENVITEVNASPNSVSNIWSGSQAQYNALTPNASTLYFIV